jgi:hypothetical protein
LNTGTPQWTAEFFANGVEIGLGAYAVNPSNTNQLVIGTYRKTGDFTNVIHHQRAEPLNEAAFNPTVGRLRPAPATDALA